jgi:hypothetical protein
MSAGDVITIWLLWVAIVGGVRLLLLLLLRALGR